MTETTTPRQAAHESLLEIISDVKKYNGIDPKVFLITPATPVDLRQCAENDEYIPVIKNPQRRELNKKYDRQWKKLNDYFTRPHLKNIPFPSWEEIENFIRTKCPLAAIVPGSDHELIEKLMAICYENGANGYDLRFAGTVDLKQEYCWIAMFKL